MNNNKKTAFSQLGLGLVDKSEHGKYYPWQVYRRSSLLLAEAMKVYPDLYSKTAIKGCENCGSHLSFKECSVDKTHPKDLVGADFCRVRLCVGCQMRRSLKCFTTTVKIVHHLQQEHKNLQFILLTLTVPNVTIDKLDDTVDHMFDSWNRLMNRNPVKRAKKGYLRCLEITYNHKRDDFHPHFHALIPVNKSYFTGKYYLSQKKWLEMWQESTRQPEITQVDVRKVKADTDEEILKACGEIAKYSTKTWSSSTKQSNRNFLGKTDELTYGVEGHLWIRDTPELTAKIVAELSTILKGRRLLQYGGLMRDAKRELKLKDGEDEGADLIHTDEEKISKCKCPVCEGDLVKTEYAWRNAISDYKAVRSTPLSEIEDDMDTPEAKKKKAESQKRMIKEDWNDFLNQGKPV